MMVNYTFRLYFGPTLLLVAVTIVTVQAFWTAFDMISVENSKSGIIATHLKVTRYKKTAYGIIGTLDVQADLNDDYDCEFKAYFSAQSNSKYVLLPYKIPRDACCTHMESIYWKSIENSLQDCSNIPKRNGNEKFCFAIKKVLCRRAIQNKFFITNEVMRLQREYEIRQLGINYNHIPKHLDPGTYKFVILLYGKGSLDSSSFATFVAKLY